MHFQIATDSMLISFFTNDFILLVKHRFFMNSDCIAVENCFRSEV